MAGKYSELSFYSHRVLVKIEGFRLQRLLEQAMKEGLQVKQVRMVSETELTCWISAQDLKKLRRLAKSRYRITSLDARGPAPQSRRLLHRPGLVLGALLAVFMVTAQVFFVETIQINGCRSIPEEALFACLQDQGIEKGTFRPEIDWEQAEAAVYETFPQVSWAQLVYSGRMVILNISETDHDIYGVDVPAEQETGEGRASYAEESVSRTYTSLVAGCSGYIESVLPYCGEAVAEKGDYVEEGQVLISGCVPLEPTTYTEEGEEAVSEYFVNAQGEVWAAVPYKLTFNQERYLWGEPEADLTSTAGSEESGEKLVVNRVEKTEKQAERKAEQQIRLWAAENLPETAEILKKSLKFSRYGNIIKVSVLLEVRQQIAIPQEETIGKKITDTRNN